MSRTRTPPPEPPPPPPRRRHRSPRPTAEPYPGWRLGRIRADCPAVGSRGGRVKLEEGGHRESRTRDEEISCCEEGYTRGRIVNRGGGGRRRWGGEGGVSR